MRRDRRPTRADRVTFWLMWSVASIWCFAIYMAFARVLHFGQ
jgi:hypothetical protein